MPVLPGGRLASRPLHFIWVCDCSASMGLDGRIESLNAAIREVLPHMRRVAESNPNAQVLVRTLRFSSGATWMSPEPVDVENFQWADLEADDLPRTAQFSAEFRDRLDREGAKTGDVQISLAWDNYNDLDLHVICPSGETIYFSNKNSSCGGELDVDMNVSPESLAPVENVYWPPGGAPLGTYRVLVNHFKNHDRPGCQDPTPFRVGVSIGGSVEEFTGSVSHGQEPVAVHEFEVTEHSATPGTGGNTDIGAALTLLADALKIPPMTERALPPVIVLLSDGVPTDDWEAGLSALLGQPWGTKAVRVAIAIGGDADVDMLQTFIGHSELRPLQANNPEALVHQIKWASTAVLQSASAPVSQVSDRHVQALNVAIPLPAEPEVSAMDVW